MYITDMRERIDRDGGLPLYRQVADALRYRIATGELKPGARLPSLRRAAELWGVNMHTVRRAYAELDAQGVVAMRAKANAVVQRPGALGEDDSAAVVAGGTVAEFLAAVLREGRLRWGLEPDDLARRLAETGLALSAGGPALHVVECSESQARDLAEQLNRRYVVQATGWSLEREGEPPGGAVVATYFHYNDIRWRWPHRLEAVRFAATHPAAALRQQVESLWAAEGRHGAIRVVLCEREAGMARNIAADLARILPAPDFEVVAEVAEPAVLLERAEGPVLFAPRIWGEMDEALRSHRSALQVRYVFEERDLSAMAASAGWRSRG
jgi:DNA-binding transcriptional regulator YhcF (GntR family)